MQNSTWVRAALLVCGGAVSAAAMAGCGGGSHFKNQLRPPVPQEVTGVVTARQVTVSPNHLGGGPIVLVISNQTQEPHTIVLERSDNSGAPQRDVVGPVNPFQAAPIQQTLTQGEYTVSADSSGDIGPATISVGPGGNCAAGKPAGPSGECPSSSNTPSLP